MGSLYLLANIWAVLAAAGQTENRAKLANLQQLEGLRLATKRPTFKLLKVTNLQVTEGL